MTAGIRNQVIRATLTIWLSHIDNQGSAPRSSSIGPRKRDSVITVGYSTSSTSIAVFHSGVTRVTPSCTRRMDPNGVLCASTEKSWVSWERSSGSAARRSAEFIQVPSCSSVRNRRIDSQSADAPSGRINAAPSKPEND